VEVYNVDEHLTPVLWTAMHTCFMSYLLVVVFALVLKELALVLVLLQLVLTITLMGSHTVNRGDIPAFTPAEAGTQ